MVIRAIGIQSQKVKQAFHACAYCSIRGTRVGLLKKPKTVKVPRSPSDNERKEGAMEGFLAWMQMNALSVCVVFVVFAAVTYIAFLRLKESDSRYVELAEEMSVAYGEFCKNPLSSRFIAGYQRLAHARCVVYRWRMAFWVFYGLAGLPLFTGISALSIWVWTW